MKEMDMEMERQCKDKQLLKIILSIKYVGAHFLNNI